MATLQTAGHHRFILTNHKRDLTKIHQSQPTFFPTGGILYVSCISLTPNVFLVIQDVSKGSRAFVQRDLSKPSIISAKSE